MGDLVITILIFVGVMGVTALLFGGWVVVSIVRFIARAMNGQPQQPRGEVMRVDGSAICPNEMCRTPNPPQAQFCRRCGRAIGGSNATRATVRRAAMW
jgi:hypothetical protein